MTATVQPKTHLLRFHVVDEESDTSVAAFIDRFTAQMWAVEYAPKVSRALKVTDTQTGEDVSLR